MSGFITCYLLAYSSQNKVPGLVRQFTGIYMGYLGGAFLKGGVNNGLERVLFRPGVKSVVNKPVDGLLYLFHVRPTRKE